MRASNRRSHHSSTPPRRLRAAGAPACSTRPGENQPRRTTPSTSSVSSAVDASSAVNPSGSPSARGVTGPSKPSRPLTVRPRPFGSSTPRRHDAAAPRWPAGPRRRHPPRSARTAAPPPARCRMATRLLWRAWLRPRMRASESNNGRHSGSRMHLGVGQEAERDERVMQLVGITRIWPPRHAPSQSPWRRGRRARWCPCRRSTDVSALRAPAAPPAAHRREMRTAAR